MVRIGKSVLAACALLGVATGIWAQTASSSPRVFYIDYEKGSDLSTGTQPSAAWKHAPGDKAASGKPAAQALQAGDRVVFSSGVTYRGQILLGYSGTAGNPIIYEGAGGAAAIIDGSEPLEVRACQSAAECGNSPLWTELSLVKFKTPVNADAHIFSANGSLLAAQHPNPANQFYRHEPDDLLPIDWQVLAQGAAQLPKALAEHAVVGARLVLWVKPNIVIERPITAIDAQGRVHFDSTGIQFYTDRPTRIGIAGAISALDQPGEYVILPGGREAVVRLHDKAGSVSLGMGRGGFDVKGRSHIEIRNLTFQNMSDAGDTATGIAVLAGRAGTSGLTIHNNVFRNMVMPEGQAPIIVRGAKDLVVKNNRIDDIVYGSGMRLSNISDSVLVEGNVITQIGRTAIMLMNVNNGIIRRNSIMDVRGVHGNGLSAYLANRNVAFIENTVLASKQPATFRGDANNTEAPNDIRFIRNILVGSNGALASLISWGAFTKDVDIKGNILIGGKHGLRMNTRDTGLVIERNAGKVPVFIGDPARGWRVSDNNWQENPRLNPADMDIVWHGDEVTGTLSRSFSRMVAFACAASTDVRDEAYPGEKRIGASLRCPE